MEAVQTAVTTRPQSTPSKVIVGAHTTALVPCAPVGSATCEHPTGPASPTAPRRRAARRDAKHATTDVGDEALVRLLMQGRDLTDAAVELIRRRLPGKDLRFIARDQAQPPADAGKLATVPGRGRAMGQLQSRDIPAGILAHQAVWMASWLAMRDRHLALREAAFTDPLTGAHNRRFFDHFLGATITHARRQHRPLIVLAFDIDDFKYFNDQYGHGAGDEILREIVQLLQSMIRPSDRVCRIGGDEFAVIFDEPTGPRTATSTPLSSVSQIARRFQRAISEHRFPKLGRDAPGSLTISGGLAAYPADGHDAESLLLRADQLALLSKRIGKNCISLGPGAENDRANDSPIIDPPRRARSRPSRSHDGKLPRATRFHPDSLMPPTRKCGSS